MIARHKLIHLFIVISLFLSLQIPTVLAGDSISRSIRVALFIETGGAYNLSSPSVTFTGGTGFDVLSKATNQLYFTQPAGQPIRFSLNQYRILVDETSDLVQAQSIISRLNGIPTYILTYLRKGQTIYRIVTGDEATYDQAWSKLNQIKSKYGFGKEILGPYALTTGVIQGENEVNNQVQLLLDAGFDAYIASTISDNNSSGYQVVIGNEGTEGELPSLLQEVSLTFPNLKVTTTNLNNTIIRQNSLDTKLQRAPHYYIPINESLLLRPLTGAIPSIAIAEKENRQYRGVMELLIYNGKLAVINELPMEEYLFSVVGTEMASGWPIEALKSQAIIARTYAIAKGNKYGIANVTDTIYDQAYYGIKQEAEDVHNAVLATSGQVLSYQGKVIEALYSSNAGGITAIGKEAWGNELPYLTSVMSPDSIAQDNALKWYRVERENGTYGYVRSDFVTVSPNKNPIGFSVGEINGSTVNFRAGPSTSTKSLDKFSTAEKVVILEIVNENNAYSWVNEPIDGVTLMNAINTRAGATTALPQTTAIEDLEITERGPSGRVISMNANGLPIMVSSPDSFRAVLGGLKSTLFDVEEMGNYSVLGAGGNRIEYPKTKDQFTIVTAGNQLTSPYQQGRDSYLLYGQSGTRVITTYPSFRFQGKGYGHGIGLSQWGARGLAEQGYDYQQILKHYYGEQVSLLMIE